MNIVDRKIKETILYVEDEKHFREPLSRYLESESYRVDRTDSLEEAERFIQRRVFDKVILDKWIGTRTSLALIPRIKSRSKDTAIILLTNDREFSSSMQALELGADEYITKPPIDRLDQKNQVTKNFFVEVYFRLHTSKQAKLLKRTNEILSRQIYSQPKNQLVGRSAVLEILRHKIRACKNQEKNVLITGETGSGKTLVSRLIHKVSNESLTLLELDCRSVNPNDLDTALFGSIQNKATNIESHESYLDKVNGGYLVIKHIDYLTPKSQKKLAQVLKTKIYRRDGDLDDTPISIRVIATSTVNLKNRLDLGTFDTELFEQISSIQISTEPLRTRVEDIMDIATYYLIRKFGPRYEFSRTAKEYLKSLEYESNVRELLVLVEMAGIKAQSKEIFEISPDCFDMNSSSLKRKLFPLKKSDVSKTHFEESLNMVEKIYLETGLSLFGNRKLELMEALDISRGTFFNKLKFHRIRKVEPNDRF